MRRQVDKNFTKQVRIDAALHHLLKIKAAREKTSLKALIEESLAEVLAVENKRKDKEDET